ncbi:short-chain dehydrogenase/reductase SDR [Usnea florida]
MPPSGLAILIGAGPTSGAGICRILAHPSHGNLAVALLARNPDNLNAVAKGLRSSTPNPVEAFPTDTSPERLSQAFFDIRSHMSFKDLKLKVAVFHVKHSSKKPFLEETHSEFTESLNAYVGGAMAFSKEVVRMLFDQHGQRLLADGGGKKGTLIFTGTLGAMRTNATFAAYGASRSGARSLAQALAKEYSPNHAHFDNLDSGIKDEDGDAQQQGKTMKAESVGKTYLWLANQEPDLWTHELDLRPAQEKF